MNESMGKNSPKNLKTRSSSSPAGLYAAIGVVSAWEACCGFAGSKGMDGGGRKGRSSRERGERQRVWLRQEEEEEEDEGEEEIGGGRRVL